MELSLGGSLTCCCGKIGLDGRGQAWSLWPWCRHCSAVEEPEPYARAGPSAACLSVCLLSRWARSSSGL